MTEHIRVDLSIHSFALGILLVFFGASSVAIGVWYQRHHNWAGASCDGSSRRDNTRGGLCFYCGRFKQSHHQSFFLGSVECTTSCYRNVLAQTCQMRKMSACRECWRGNEQGVNGGASGFVALKAKL
jgi:hypothetical protein